MRGELHMTRTGGGAAFPVVTVASMLAACTHVGPSGPTKHDLISVEFGEPRALTSDVGNQVQVAAVLGRVESALPRRARMRIHEAYDAEGEPVPGFRGMRIPLTADDLSRVELLERDLSGEKMAAALGTGIAVVAATVVLILAYLFSGS